MKRHAAKLPCEACFDKTRFSRARFPVRRVVFVVVVVVGGVVVDVVVDVVVVVVVVVVEAENSYPLPRSPLLWLGSVDMNCFNILKYIECFMFVFFVFFCRFSHFIYLDYIYKYISIAFISIYTL